MVDCDMIIHTPTYAILENTYLPSVRVANWSPNSHLSLFDVTFHTSTYNYKVAGKFQIHQTIHQMFS